MGVFPQAILCDGSPRVVVGVCFHEQVIRRQNFSADIFDVVFVLYLSIRILMMSRTMRYCSVWFICYIVLFIVEELAVSEDEAFLVIPHLYLLAVVFRNTNTTDRGYKR